MKTKERLAGVLSKAGLANLAADALRGRFDDYESDSATPIVDLVSRLRASGREDLAQRAIGGEWDGTREEAQQWYEREGRAAIEGTRPTKEADP